MSLHVVDASAAAKRFNEEEHADAALSVLDERNRLHAPDIFLLDTDGVVCKWIRRGVITAEEAAEVRAALRRHPVRLHPFPSLLDSAYGIACGTGQSIYDCLYVALAALLGGRMVTADRRPYGAPAPGPFGKHVLWIEDAA